MIQKKGGAITLKIAHKIQEMSSHQGNFVSKTRLNLNELLERRKQEKMKTKKKNIYIFSGTSALAAIILIILSF